MMLQMFPVDWLGSYCKVSANTFESANLTYLINQSEKTKSYKKNN